MCQFLVLCFHKSRYIYRQFFDKGLVSVSQLQFQQNNLESLDSLRKDLRSQCNFLVWAGLRSAIPLSLRHQVTDVGLLDRLSFSHNSISFDATLAKSKQYYNLLIQRKAVLPKGPKTLQNKFTVLDSVSLSKIYLLSRNVCFETYLRDLQFKVLNFITCTNVLLKRMGIVDSDMCTFCKLIKEDVEHLFFRCPFSSSFWTDFEAFWRSNMNETINLSLQDIIVGINNEKSKFLNYCILVGKSTIFHSRKINKKPSLELFKIKPHQKYSTELFIAQKWNKLNKFKEKWMFKPLI